MPNVRIEETTFSNTRDFLNSEKILVPIHNANIKMRYLINYAAYLKWFCMHNFERYKSIKNSVRQPQVQLSVLCSYFERNFNSYLPSLVFNLYK